jgi:transposase-like protein
MAAAYRVVVAERKEIATITIICPDCTAEVSVDAQTARIPFACPSCSKDFSDQLREALNSLGRFHRLAATEEGHAGKPLFRFSIKQAD